MISTDFAPNESWDDAWLSLKLLLQPWKWRSGIESKLVKKNILSKFQISNNKYQISFFLSGRSALYFLLKSLNLPKGSEVLIQAFTCEAVVLPIIELDLKPVYVDIEVHSYSLDYRFLTNKLTPLRPSGFAGQANKPKVLILQHTFGLTPKFRKEIIRLAQEKDLIIIEDLAHGFNQNVFVPNNQYPITNNYYLLSFGRSKMLSSVFGGALVSSNQVTSKLANQLTYPDYGFIFLCLLYKPLIMLIKSTYDFFYLGKMLHKILEKSGFLIPEITKKEKEGNYDQIFNKAYPNALAILLIHQLNKFERVQRQRAKICSYYSRVIQYNTSGHPERLAKDLATGGSVKSNKNASLDSSFRFAPFRMTKGHGLIRFPLLAENRDELIKKLKEKKIFLGKWYDQVVGPNDLDLNRVKYKLGSCPVAEEICKKIINLPTNISESEAERVVNYLKSRA
ncbi:hypothetical protein A2767_03500 [Candidatus Roizmanbacteria bacterium RIFCSPHIGHO2_01_FULL_35_10]|uniref:Aminotransferase class I/classII domain-containing protein n=1 Tax=Candidatus Roizmanbacteria bacterium RIFCSPLOWO2_01_FULL_35_13 TaxID=1802055 RepID=A0A1F7IEU0_9BACT|nr:MAG: hypothetical protein A2767_03500 [Candidatus Roizmanbacteria bacterium RIFCSPHIGHO2_01_FULL_35_10]OGK41867.1 MAG: hypothetical protein A3A74_02535 [Candidatus Roizmanbacteria bacterium RIFCSPLOWO2_01_FULL_35_13]